MDPRYPTGQFVFNPQATADTRRTAVAAIGSFPSELQAVLPSASIDKPYREGGWTARQVVHHLADSHMNAFIRFRLALTEDKPTIKLYNETEWAKLVDSTTEDPAVSVQILTGLHRRWHRMLEAMSQEDFNRAAVHPDRGPVTLDWFLQLYAWHGRHHIGHLKLPAA
ncbi:MAG: YfiT family bacillithiol transferase [Vicinamibacterales bacterium]